jgi:hypothetical protein
VNTVEPQRPVALLEIYDPRLDSKDFAGIAHIFDQMAIPKRAKRLRTNTAVAFMSYEDDPREDFIIDEIRRFVQALDQKFPYVLYCLIPEQIFFWIACLLPLSPVHRQESQIGIEIEAEPLAELLVNRIVAIEALCERILDDERPIIEKILKEMPAPVTALTLLKLDDLFDEDEQANRGF